MNIYIYRYTYVCVCICNGIFDLTKNFYSLCVGNSEKMDQKTNNEQEATDTLAQLKSPITKHTDNDLRHRHRFYRHRKMSFPAVSFFT